MSAHFRVELTGITNANYDDDPTHRASFGAQQFNVRVRFISGTNALTFSFNGKDDHGIVHTTGGRAQEKLFEDVGPVNLVQFKGGTGNEIVEVEAW